MYKPNIGDIVYFDKNPFKHVVTGVQNLTNGHTLVHVLTLDNEDGYNGWFNADKVKLLYKFSTNPNPVQKDLEVEFTRKDAIWLNTPVIPKMTRLLNHAIVKDLDDKIRRDLEDE